MEREQLFRAARLSPDRAQHAGRLGGGEPDDYVFIRYFGNNANTRPLLSDNNLAILLRTRRIRDIKTRKDWDTPGSWRVERHPRLLGDLKGSGGADIVGFGDGGVWTALGNGDGTFKDPQFVLADLGFEAGGWRVDKHPRMLADLRGNGRSDIVAFGDAGVFVALSNGDGTFAFNPQPVVPDFGHDQGWRVDRHPRFVLDVNNDGFADIVGFGDAGVYIAFGNGDGTFNFTPIPVLDDFGFNAGGWRVDRHPRFLADVRGIGRIDIVGFGDDGVFIAFGNGDGTFNFTPVPVINDFGFDAGGWRVDKHPRALAKLTSSGRADVVGFGDAGVLVSVNQGVGAFALPPLFVIPNFGYGDSGPFQQQGPFLPAVSIGVVQASGGHAATVFYVGGDLSFGLWKWTEGMPAWQMLVPGGGASQAIRFFVNPYDPALVYIVDRDRVRRSDDGGLTWQVDTSLEQQLTCGGRIPFGRTGNEDGIGDFLDVLFTDMQFDPHNPRRRFAVGLAGAFMTQDGGASWQRLLDTGALRGRPSNCYLDGISDPANPALYVSFAGRSIIKITDL